MFEINGVEISLEQLQKDAKKHNMDFNSYMDKMRGDGLVEVTQGAGVLKSEFLPETSFAPKVEKQNPIIPLVSEKETSTPQSFFDPSSILEDVLEKTVTTEEEKKDDDREINIKDYYENKITGPDLLSDRTIQLSNTYSIELDKQIEKQNKKNKIVQQEIFKTHGPVINEDGSTRPKNYVDILADALGNDVYFNPNSGLEIFTQGGLYGGLPTIPVHENRDVNEYIYGTSLGVETTFWDVGLFSTSDQFDITQPNAIERLTRKILEDKGGGLKLVKNEIDRRNGLIVKDNYEKKYGKGLYLKAKIDEHLENYLVPVEKEIADLYDAGKWEEALAKANDLGFQPLYTKDKKFIGWIPSAIEEQAKIIAETTYSTDVDALEAEVRTLMYELVGLGPIIEKFKDEMDVEYDFEGTLKAITEENLFIQRDETLLAIEEMNRTGLFVKGLSQLPVNHPAAKQWNEKIEKLLVLNRALQINMDPTLIEEELFVLPFDDEYAGMTRDDQVEIAINAFEDMGYDELEDDLRVRDGSQWFEGTGVKMFGDKLEIREVAEASRDFVTGIIPLIASIYATKRLPVGMFKTTAAATAAGKKLKDTKTLGDIIKRKSAHTKKWLVNSSDSPTRRRLAELTVGGVEELTVLFLADEMSKRVFKSDPFVYNHETGEFNWEFAFGLGVGNQAGKMLMNRLYKAPLVANIQRKASQIKILDYTSGTLGGGIQQSFGATAGIGSMEVAKIFSGDSEIMHWSKLDEEEKFNLMKHTVGEWFGMWVMGAVNPNSGVWKGVGRDINNFSINVFKISNASRTLGIKEGLVGKDKAPYKEGHAGYNEIEAAKRKKRKEIANSNLLKKEKIKKQKEINDAAEVLHFRNELAEAKQIYKNENIKLEEFEKKITLLNNKIRSNQAHTPRDIMDIAAMTDAQFDYWKIKLSGSRISSGKTENLDIMRNQYQNVVRGVNKYLKGTKGRIAIDSKIIEKTIKETVELGELNYEKKQLKNSNKDGINDGRIALLNEKIKNKTEAVKEISKQFEVDIARRVETEVKVAKIIAEELGAKFEIAKDTKDYINNLGGDKKSAGFYDYEKNRIVVNPEAAVKARTVGTGIHEVGHYILKDVLKDPKTNKISEKGIAVIDKFLDKLDAKDRKILEDLVKENYGGNTNVRKKDGTFYKEKKNEYYEEYLTQYVEALKNKQIKLDRGNIATIKDMIYPHLRKVFPNLGRKGEAYSVETADGIKRLLDDLYSASERGFSKYEMGRFMQKNAAKVAEGALQNRKKKAFSNVKMEEINKLAEKWTREEWKGPESDPTMGKWLEVYTEILPDLIAVTTSKVKDFVKNTNLPSVDVDRLVWSTVQEMGGMNPGQVKLGGHIRNFDITQKKYEVEGQDFGLSGWINDRINSKMYNVLKKGESTKKTFEKPIDEGKIKEIIDEGPSVIDIIDKQLDVGITEGALGASKKVKIYEAMAEVSKVKGKIAKEINTEVQAPFMIDGKVNEAKLNEFTKGMIYKTVPNLTLESTTKLFTTSNATYESGPMAGKLIAPEIARKIRENKDLNIQDIKAVQPFMDKTMSFIVDGWPQGFTTIQKKYIDIIKGEKIEKSIQVPDASTGMPKKILELGYNQRSIRGVLTPSGKKVTTKSGPQGQYKIDNIDIKAVKEAVGINRDGTYSQVVTKHSQLIKAIISRFDQSMVSQGLREIMPESMAKRFLELRDGTSTKRYSKVNPKEYIPTAEEFIMNSLELMRAIEKRGIENVYDLRSKSKDLKLLPDYKYIDKYTSDFMFFENYNKGLLFDVNLDRAIKKTFQKGVGAGTLVGGGGRGPIYEQAIINIAGKVGAGVEVLTTRVAEGGVPDLHARIHGRDFFVEVKMANAQHGSVTINSLDINTGKSIIKKGFTFNSVVEKLITETQSGRESFQKRLAEEGITWNKFGDQIPLKLYNELKAEGYVDRMSKTDMDFSIDNISEIYNKKPGYPNYYINIQGKGLHWMGQNPLGLNVPKLQGQAILTLRPFRGKATKDGMVRLTYRAIPQVVYNSLSRSKYSIGNNLEWSNLMKSPEVKLLERQNSKKLISTNLKTIQNIAGGKIVKAMSKVSNNEIIKQAKIIDKAFKLGRIKNKKSRGMSTWDFDDTLATTKSGVRARIPNLSGNPKPSRKVVFLAGGAGSGKSNVVKKLGLEKQGFKIVNQDISLEWLKKNSGLPENMNDLTKEQRSTLGKLQHQAREIAKRKMMKYKGNADGVVIDGTGGSIKAMEKLVNEFKEKGYDVSMLFVETSLETALKRNKARKERSLLDKIVERNHASVQANKSGFMTMFKDRFMEVKTDDLKIDDAMPKDLINKMNDFVKSYEKIRLDAEQFATQGQNILNKGGKFDFSEFNVVTEGAQGPFFKKAMDRAKKFGTKDQFVLTARPPESAGPIREFLKSQGLDIPLENITGLGNSTAEAKAMWMLKKFSEGYNDMYFADDAIQNVKAVKDVLSQLDIKSKVQRAYSKVSLNEGVNKIMEYSLDIGSKKIFSKAEAKVRGKDIKRRRFFITDSAADLELLIEPLYGKGKKGIENKKWFDENFINPFERGINDYNVARQTTKNDYMNLRKQNKDVVKQLSKPVEGTTFTNDMAMRVYLWNKAGFKIPDLAKTTETKLVEHIKNNPKLQAYAEQFARITKQEKGLKEPGQNWWGETMAGEVTNIDRGVSRKQHLQEWIDVKNEIFSETNLNKMESKLGTRWRENIEDMFDRMETGRTRSLKLDRGSAAMIDYLNGSVGTIMNFNTRSAALQTISTINFLNMRENNPIAAARAMGNVKQFSKDFMKIMNSDMLKQRRDGLEINVTEAELASAAASSKNPINAMIAKVLKVGYLPTKLADSFAISFGGATYYRNRIKMYEKQGLSMKEAEAKAWTDFQKLSERTQQSSRPDLLSKQQTSLAGRIILPFANTPMQMNRRGMKDILDIHKGRYKNTAELGEKMGRISYYMGAQVAIFAGLQSALFAMLLNDEDVSEDKIAKTKTYTLNTISDSFLRGMGIPGAIASGFKNATIEYFKQSGKGYNADYSEVGEALLNISPPVGSKFGKLDAAGNMIKWAKIKKKDEFKFELNNPSLEAGLLTVEALTNIPLHRAHKKSNNIIHSLNSDYENWQRAHMVGGWTPWNVGIERDKKEKEKSNIKKIKTKQIKTKSIKVKQL